MLLFEYYIEYNMIIPKLISAVVLNFVSKCWSVLFLGLADLLNVCKNLRKLSLEHCTVNDNVCAAIGQNHNLDVLNMSACYGVTQSCIKNILTGCRK
jgi:hypothetical protein